MSKRGLGRGFDSLIPTDVTVDMPAAVRPTSGEAIQQVDPAKILPNPQQPRQNFDAAELQGLADSIKQHGVLHPPVVQSKGGGTYELIAGERRVRAAKLAGLAQIPVIVRSYDEQQQLELALLENVQRSELNPIETATAYRKLVDEFNLTLDSLGQRMGKAKSTVANTIRLLSLSKAAREAVANGVISEAHGRAILAVEGAQRQQDLLDHVVKEHWTVRQAEEFARNQKPQAKSTPAVPAGDNPLAQELGSYLGTKVKMQSKAKGGRLIIEYQSDNDLQRIVDTIKPN